MQFVIGQKIKLITGEEVEYIGPGIPGPYPNMDGIQETILGKSYEFGSESIGTYFLFQIKENEE